MDKAKAFTATKISFTVNGRPVGNIHVNNNVVRAKSIYKAMITEATHPSNKARGVNGYTINNGVVYALTECPKVYPEIILR
jgi:hypothetical protein